MILRRLLAVIMFAFSLDASAAPAPNDPCANVNVEDPNAVLACINATRTRNMFLNDRQVCYAHQYQWSENLRERGVEHALSARELIPSCPVFAEAVRLGIGKEPVWAACLSTRGGIGSEAHIRACVESMSPSVFNKTADALSGCGDIFAVYEKGLWDATPRTVEESWLRLFGQLPADFKWISAGVC